MDIGQLIKIQVHVQTNMERVLINYRKDGKERRKRIYYKKKLNTLSDDWAEFKKRDREIAMLRTNEHDELPYFVDDVYSTTEELFLVAYSTLETDFLEQYGDDTVNDTGVNNTTSASEGMIQPYENPKLPKMPLPTFDGNYLEWVGFYDLFNTLIHENKSISLAQKLQYLKAYLTGDAKDLLSTITISDSNYLPAWKLLQERYNNKRVIVKAHLETLFLQSKITQEDAKRIKTLLDQTSKCLTSLQNLHIPTENWDPILVYLTVQKLPHETHCLWEQQVSDRLDLPSWEELRHFLQVRFRTLEALEVKGPDTVNRTKAVRKIKTFHASCVVCVLCGNDHSLRRCPKYLDKGQAERYGIVKSQNLCVNCLGLGHTAIRCPSKDRCYYCKNPHHSTLHRNREQREVHAKRIVSAPGNGNWSTNNQSQYGRVGAGFDAAQAQVNPKEMEASTSLKTFFAKNIPQAQSVLLATAMVMVCGPGGHYQLCRALIDPGSQGSFITERVARNLKLRQHKVQTVITGVLNMESEIIKTKAVFQIKSPLYDNNSINVQAFIVKTITNLAPTCRRPGPRWTHIAGLTLADPNFDSPGYIDVLLGADVYADIIAEGLRKGPSGTPVAQNTSLGWILCGTTDTYETTTSQVESYHVSVTQDDDLRKFWELEEVAVERTLTLDEKSCEQFYKDTVSRDINGRYIVRLPFILPSSEISLGISRKLAIARLLRVEKHLERNEGLRREYTKCIQEYLEVGHMEEILKDETTQSCYLPHHAVVKPSSSTTKVRVVFDASCPTSNGSSLNDLLHKGPTIQEPLVSVLLRWRKHRIAYMADIQKMYRQIRIHRDDAEFQRIVWRDAPGKPIKDYRLLTVTFGTKSAPYLAIRTLKELAKDGEKLYPTGSLALREDFYVDDFMSGADTTKEALEQCDQLKKLLRSGGFELRKWASNHNDVLEPIAESDREVNIPLQVNMEEIKALGMYWNPATDMFLYKVDLQPLHEPFTKRKILSQIAKLFDPTGWLAPIIILGKILIQTLWQTGLDWDEPVSEEIVSYWKKYDNSLSGIQTLQIPRWIKLDKLVTCVELHGFCDASMKAYAAVIYVRISDCNGDIHVHLLQAKTKVAPIKTVTLPRLELCGAALLTKLLIQVKTTMKMNVSQMYAWTDSTIVLAWLRKHPSTLTTFVANRVTHIYELIKRNIWNHVTSAENPADCASRGLTPNELRSHHLWWTGPTWLKQAKHQWPQHLNQFETSLESRPTVTTLLVTDTTSEWNLLERFSNLSKLVRVTAYCLRFIKKLKGSCENHMPSYLTSEELNQALNFWIRHVQKSEFRQELTCLQHQKPIASKSRLLKLNPFFHEDGLLRVGGRLNNSALSFSEKHPIILPDKNHLSVLIVRNMHITTLHGGVQLMFNLLRQKYWILNARNLIKSNNYKCTVCFRQKGVTRNQLMANLPSCRVNVNRPFAHSGIDYCGPFDIKSSKGRGIRSYKGYVAVFVCMAVKAIHLELVSDLSTAGFLAAFKRFVSRRGLCTDVYSDCGSNFVGANSLLIRHKNDLLKGLETEIAQSFEEHGVKWHFIPPASPHMGGLWEAGVKSVKYHLKRILGKTVLTYEAMNTLLAQIEAVLNSRPLTPMSQDSEDLSALTPGHFLIGGPLLSPPERKILDVKTWCLDRYQLVQQLFQTFWKRWSLEYLNQLQQRPKWLRTKENVKPNDMVLIKDERLPPTRWLLGRIIDVHKGSDNLVRIVTVRTHNAILERPVTKICLLPIDDNKYAKPAPA